MGRGDHIFCFRTLKYTHHGIDCGDGTAIHFSGEPLSKSNAEICKATLDEFADGDEIFVVKYERQDYLARKSGSLVAVKIPLPREQVVAHAYSRLGESGYHLFENNCEHFAVWCKTGIPECKQFIEVGRLAGGTFGAFANRSLIHRALPKPIAEPLGWWALASIAARWARYTGAPFPWGEHEGVKKALEAAATRLPPRDDLPFDVVPYEY